MLKFPNLQIGNHIPVTDLETLFLTHQVKIEDWFSTQWQISQPPVYGSIDLRNSGFKLTPVDMNLFSGGFNNVHPQFLDYAITALQHVLPKLDLIKHNKVLLIPENHTRNLAYLKNVYTLLYLLKQVGLEVEVGSLSELVTDTITIEVEAKQPMQYHALVRDGNLIKTKSGFIPDLVLLNNDLSHGKPDILDGISQKVFPPLNAGWYMRKKSHFFAAYDQVCNEFAELLGIDPWRLNAYFDVCSGLDFAKRIGLEELAAKVDALIAKIKLKYEQYQLDFEPYVIVKANNGTYGMGIMAVKSGSEIIAINRKGRNKMSVIKDGYHVTDVILQEGVHTIEQLDGHTSETVIYMIDEAVIGSFYRVHPEKAQDENLNSVGAKFVPLAFANNNAANRFYPYSVIARLTMLAAAQELINHP